MSHTGCCPQLTTSYWSYVTREMAWGAGDMGCCPRGAAGCRLVLALALTMSRDHKQRVCGRKFKVGAGVGQPSPGAQGGHRPRTPVALLCVDLAEVLALVFHTHWGTGQQGPCLLVSCLWSMGVGPPQNSSRSLPEACPPGCLPPGTAVRHCDEHRGWLPPNLFNCTSVTFSELKGFVSEPSSLHLLAPHPVFTQDDVPASPVLRKGTPTTPAPAPRGPCPELSLPFPSPCALEFEFRPRGTSLSPLCWTPLPVLVPG